MKLDICLLFESSWYVREGEILPLSTFKTVLDRLCQSFTELQDPLIQSNHSYKRKH